MNTVDLERYLANVGYVTIDNIRTGMPQASNQKEIGQHLKALTVKGKLEVMPGFASGPRMYRLRRAG